MHPHALIRACLLLLDIWGNTLSQLWEAARLAVLAQVERQPWGLQVSLLLASWVVLQPCLNASLRPAPPDLQIFPSPTWQSLLSVLRKTAASWHHQLSQRSLRYRLLFLDYGCAPGFPHLSSSLWRLGTLDARYTSYGRLFA